MKQVVFLLLLCLLGLGAAKASKPSYVVSDGEVYQFEEVHLGLLGGINGVSADEKTHFKSSEVQAFCRNGYLLEKMPIIEDGHTTGHTTYMEPVCSRNGYVLYRYTPYVDSWEQISFYHVFKDGEYVLTIEPKNREQLIRYFSRE